MCIRDRGRAWYVSNQRLHTDLKIPLIKEEIHRIPTKYSYLIIHHEKELINYLYNTGPDERRLRTRELGPKICYISETTELYGETSVELCSLQT